MIRYVVAVILTVAIFGIAFTALDHGAAMNSERIVEDDVTDLESAAVTLYQEEELAPRGQPGPRRTVTVDLPRDTLTTVPVDGVIVKPIGENRTAVSFDLAGRPRSVIVFDVPTTIAGSSDQLELEGTGSRELVLTLVRDEEGDRVVRIDRS